MVLDHFVAASMLALGIGRSIMKSETDFEPLSGREFPRFSGVKTFFRLPMANVDQHFEIALCGVPFDGGTTYRPGTRFAPSRVRELSSLGRGFHWGRDVHVFKRIQVADVGDCPTVPIDLVQTYRKIETYFEHLLKAKKRFVAVGGDHSITLPILRALRKHLEEPLQLIHFDAHLDTYPAAWGCEFHHGSFLRHAVQEGLVDPKQTVQIGVRGPLAYGDDLEFSKQHGIRLLSVKDLRGGDLGKLIKKTSLSSTMPTYISYDVDCLDPAYAPGTGTPVPGGLTTYEVQQVFQNLALQNVVGGDIVEVSPPFDSSDLTTLAAVDALFEMLALMAELQSSFRN